MNKKDYIKSYNWFQTFCTTKTCPILWKYTIIKNELDEKSNHIKIAKFSNFERKRYKGRDSNFKPFGKKIMFIGFKCIALGACHMCRK
jgi:hypothetical protein